MRGSVRMFKDGVIVGFVRPVARMAMPHPISGQGFDSLLDEPMYVDR